MTKTFKTAKQASKELMVIASAFEIAMNTTHTDNDMGYHANAIIEMGDYMKKEGKFSYTDVVYVRTRGVESTMERVNAMHDTLLATITFGYDTNEKVWFVRN